MKNHTRYCRSWNVFCWARSLNMNLKGFQCFKKTFVFKGKELSLCPLLGQNLTWLILISDRFIKSNKLPLIPLSLHLDIKWAVSPKSWSCCGSVQVVLVTQPVWYHISPGPCLLTRNPDYGAPYDMNWNNNEALLLLGTLITESLRALRWYPRIYFLIHLWITPVIAGQVGSPVKASPSTQVLVPGGPKVYTSCRNGAELEHKHQRCAHKS